jgi:hypothetical protein
MIPVTGARTTAVKNARHANHVECRWILSHVGKPSVVKSAKEKTALRPQDKHGRVPAAIKSVLDGAGSAAFFRADCLINL